MNAATIHLFLPNGDAQGLRIASVPTWAVKALAAPRTELKSLVERQEANRAGVYLLSGRDASIRQPNSLYRRKRERA